jgi:hypothetical protein
MNPGKSIISHFHAKSRTLISKLLKNVSIMPLFALGGSGGPVGGRGKRPFFDIDSDVR